MVKTKEATSKFIRVRCQKCKKEQIIFGKIATKVVCGGCSEVMAEPTGGKATIHARILEVLE